MCFLVAGTDSREDDLEETNTFFQEKAFLVQQPCLNPSGAPKHKSQHMFISLSQLISLIVLSSSVARQQQQFSFLDQWCHNQAEHGHLLDNSVSIHPHTHHTNQARAGFPGMLYILPNHYDVLALLEKLSPPFRNP